MGVEITSVVELPANRRLEETHRARIRRAAECLTSPAPSCLIAVLSRFSFDVKTQNHVDAFSPTRKQHFETNAAANHDARRLFEFLQQPFVTDFLTAHSPQSEGLRHQFEPFLLQILVATHEARKTLLDEHGKVPSGAGRARLPGALPPARYVCAAIIMEAAQFLAENGFSTPSKTALYDAATELWTSLLPLEGWGNTRRFGWKSYFDDNGDDSLIRLRHEVRRQLDIEMSLFSLRK
ncbi:hypothetical protein JQ629_09115 [Bradyrhizobium sp. AUGA SZCCT0222]|uniref:hypothetical protein n=1 Tax=Bradyrhizobium sp. AUGA SZCCT0222 TaxID=2807668 RepID=UPI001BA72E7D|nr:hypothetical protein [Bradyrhizobium sp. AUGA SZCCT0222]MBR1267666.1 hypothetical protein [Bradyrhizobium sp. AUGA SZCCT0222]